MTRTGCDRRAPVIEVGSPTASCPEMLVGAAKEMGSVMLAKGGLAKPPHRNEKSGSARSMLTRSPSGLRKAPPEACARFGRRLRNRDNIGHVGSEFREDR